MKKLSSLFVVAFVLFGVGSEAHAHQKYSYKTKGNQASFSTWTYDECSYSGVSVWAFEEQQRGSEKASYGAVYVDYYSYNYCTGHSEYGFSYFDSTNFSQQKLNSASLDANGTMEISSCDYGMGGGDGDGDGDGDGPADAGTGSTAGAGGMGGGPAPPYYNPCTYTTAPVELSIDWTGNGDTYKDRSTNTYSSPYSRYRYRYTGQYRDATIAGLFSIGGTDVDLGSGWGSLSQSSSGSFEMYR